MSGSGPAKIVPIRLCAGFEGQRFPRRVVFYPIVTSTQDIARNLADSGAESGLLVVAGCQTEGRGRFGRSWHSPQDLGLYLSVLLRPRCRPRELVWWTLGAAVAMWDTCRRHGASVELKWPNDLVARGAKLGGVLAESRSAGESVEYLIVGIGLNLYHHPRDFPTGFDMPAISLSEITTSPTLDSSQIAIDLACELGRRFEELDRSGPCGIGQAWEARSPSSRGQRVRVRSTDSESWLEGLSDGLDDEAGLRVRLDCGRTIETRLVDTVRPVVAAGI